MVEKILKGSMLGIVFGVAGYFIFKDIEPALFLAFIMFMSMFVGKKN